LLQFKMS